MQIVAYNGGGGGVKVSMNVIRYDPHDKGIFWVLAFKLVTYS